MNISIGDTITINRKKFVVIDKKKTTLKLRRVLPVGSKHMLGRLITIKRKRK